MAQWWWPLTLAETKGRASFLNATNDLPSSALIGWGSSRDERTFLNSPKIKIPRCKQASITCLAVVCKLADTESYFSDQLWVRTVCQVANQPPADSCSSSAHCKCLHPIYHHQHTFSVYLPLHSELCLARKTRLHQTFNSPSLPTPVSWWYWVGCPCGKQRPLTRTPDTGPHRRSGAHRGRARSSGWKWNTCNGPCPGLSSASPPPQSLSARRASCRRFSFCDKNVC